MIDQSTITAALKRQLVEDEIVLRELPGVTVTRAERLNLDPGRTPWVGVYRAEVEYEPGRLGAHARQWYGRPTARVVVQAAGSDGEEVEDRLEGYVATIFAAIDRDQTIGGTVAFIRSYRVAYSYAEDDADTLSFQMATITVEAEATTGTRRT